MRVVVTGGAGFIGSSLCEVLLRAGHDVAAVDNLDPFYDPAAKLRNLRTALDYKRFRWDRVDILDKENLDRTIRCESPEIIVHLAARAGVRDSLRDAQGYVRTNVEGTSNVLRAAVSAGARRVVFASSSSVYGASRMLPVKESANFSPMSPYAETKVASERLCYEFSSQYDLQVFCLRLFTVFGPRQRPDMAIHKFARAIVARQSIQLFHNGESARDYMFVADAVRAIAAATEVPGLCEVVNVGSGRPVHLSDVANSLGRALGCAPTIEMAPAPTTDPTVTWADISKARSVLGYQPQVPFESGIQLFVEWFEALGGKSILPSRL